MKFYIILIVSLFSNVLLANEEVSNKKLGEFYKKGVFLSKFKGTDINEIKTNMENSYPWFLKAAEQDHLNSQLIITDYLNISPINNPIKKDRLFWLNKAANNGSIDAILELRNIYYDRISDLDSKLDYYSMDLNALGIIAIDKSSSTDNILDREIYSKDNEYKELQNSQKDTAKELIKMIKIKSRLKRDLDKYKKKSKNYLKPYAAKLVDGHIKFNRDADDYKGSNSSNYSPACEGAFNPLSISPKFCHPWSCQNLSEDAFIGFGCHIYPSGVIANTRDEWTNKLISKSKRGYVHLKICGPVHGVSSLEEQCKEWLEEYINVGEKLETVKAEIDIMKEDIKNLSEQRVDKKEDIHFNFMGKKQ